MALEDKLDKLIDALEKVVSPAAARRSITGEQTGLTGELSSAAVGSEEFKKALNDLNIPLQSIRDKMEAINSFEGELLDREQVRKTLKEEELEVAKRNFEILQLSILKEIEVLKAAEKQGDLGKEAVKKSKEKLEALQNELKEYTKIIEGAEKEKKIKQDIKNIGIEILNNSKQQVLALEKHILELSKATGGYASINSELREAGRLSLAATVGTGITGEETRSAVISLAAAFTSLNNYSGEAIASMQVATAQLTKVGLSGADAARGFDTLVNAMGKTPQQAAKIQESFVQMAAKNKLALSSVSQAFAENSSRLVGFGNDMTKVLDGLAEQSLKTGVAIGKLIGIAQGFDTFEDASRKVGSLNALLGGDYFNSIEMLTASDEERIRLLKDGVAASGMQWESMNRFQKMAIANAAGISDLNEASKLFGKTSLENSKQQAAAAEVQKTLAEQAESVSLATDKLKSSFNGLMIAVEPFASAFIEIVSILAKVIQVFNQIVSIGGEFPKFGAIVTGVILFTIPKINLLGTAFSFLSGKVKDSLSGLLNFSNNSLKAADGAVKSGTGIASSIRTIGAAAKRAGVGLLFLGAAVFLIGAGIGIAAFGMASLVKSFKDLTGGQILGALASLIAVMGGFTIILGILAFVAIKAAIPLSILGANLMFIGAAVMLIGAGIGAAAAGIGYMAGNIAELVTSFSSDSISKVNQFAEAVTNLNKPFKELNSNLLSIVNNLQSMGLDMKAEMSVSPTTMPAPITEAVQATAAAASQTTAAAGTAAAGKTLIPAAQTTVVPMVVQIDKVKIIEILKKDIEKIAQNIAGDETMRVVDAMGFTQSAFNVQAIPERGTK